VTSIENDLQRSDNDRRCRAVAWPSTSTGDFTAGDLSPTASM
jgi:hypothetical protein